MWLLGGSWVCPDCVVTGVCTEVLVRQLVHFGRSHGPDQAAERWSLWGSLALTDGSAGAGVAQLWRRSGAGGLVVGKWLATGGLFVGRSWAGRGALLALLLGERSDND
jgi:hypothetical protein